METIPVVIHDGDQQLRWAASRCALANLRAGRRDLRTVTACRSSSTRCRFAENAWFIKEREAGLGRSTRSPTSSREMAALADGMTMSAKKDGLANIGGWLGDERRLAGRALPQHADPDRGFPTYGGLAGRDLEAIAQGSRRWSTRTTCSYRIRATAYLGEALTAAGVPVVLPVGGHAVYIDARALLPHIPPLEYPGQALAVALYREGGIRGCEIGTVMFGRQADGSEKPAAHGARAARDSAPCVHAVTRGLCGGGDPRRGGPQAVVAGNEDRLGTQGAAPFHREIRNGARIFERKLKFPTPIPRSAGRMLARRLSWPVTRTFSRPSATRRWSGSTSSRRAGVNVYVKVEVVQPDGLGQGPPGARRHRGRRAQRRAEARADRHRGHQRQHRHRPRHGVRAEGLSAGRRHGRELQRRAPQADALPRRQGRADAGGREGQRHARQGRRAGARRTAGSCAGSSRTRPTPTCTRAPRRRRSSTTSRASGSTTGSPASAPAAR